MQAVVAARSVESQRRDHLLRGTAERGQSLVHGARDPRSEDARSDASLGHELADRADPAQLAHDVIAPAVEAAHALVLQLAQLGLAEVLVPELDLEALARVLGELLPVVVRDDPV